VTRKSKNLAYVGTYTSAVDGDAHGEGIYLLEMNPTNGELSQPTLVANTQNPSWISIHPSRKYLYAINEIANFNGSNGSVSAFAMDETSGSLTALNTMSSAGAGPAHMSIDASGTSYSWRTILAEALPCFQFSPRALWTLQSICTKTAAPWAPNMRRTPQGAALRSAATMFRMHT